MAEGPLGVLCPTLCCSLGSKDPNKKRCKTYRAGVQERKGGGCVCVARRTGLASLQLSCQLDPRSACHPRPPGQSLPSGRGLYSNHSHLWIKETSPCPHGQVGQGVSGTLLPFCTGQQFCRKGVEAVSGPTPASCSFLHRLCLLYLPKLLFAPQPLWLPVPVGTWHGVRRPTMPK